MKRLRPVVVASLVCLLAGAEHLAAQAGPKKEGSETVARPRKKTGGEGEAAEESKIPSKFGKKKEQTPPPQQITGFEMGEAPLTVCMVIEFSNLFQQYWTETWYQTLTAAYGFLETLKPEDYVAVVAYDIRPEILSDFSTDKRAAYEAMQRLRIAAYSESNLFDALTDTAQRMSDIEGRKAIVLISSGIDTFSKITFSKTREILQNAGVPIYAIGLMQALREWYDAYGMLGPIARLDFLQADNQLRTFAKETGGIAFFPRFYGEFPGIFRSISQALRSRYYITYQPSNLKRDGKFRKIKVELVNPATNEPLKITDERGKPVKYTIIAKSGYTAPREVE